MQESEQKVITLTGVDELALEELINFAYCGRVSSHTPGFECHPG